MQVHLYLTYYGASADGIQENSWRKFCENQWVTKSGLLKSEWHFQWLFYEKKWTFEIKATFFSDFLKNSRRSKNPDAHPGLTYPWMATSSSGKSWVHEIYIKMSVMMSLHNAPIFTNSIDQGWLHWLLSMALHLCNC